MNAVNTCVGVYGRSGTMLTGRLAGWMSDVCVGVRTNTVFVSWRRSGSVSANAVDRLAGCGCVGIVCFQAQTHVVVRRAICIALTNLSSFMRGCL